MSVTSFSTYSLQDKIDWSSHSQTYCMPTRHFQSSPNFRCDLVGMGWDPFSLLHIFYKQQCGPVSRSGQSNTGGETTTTGNLFTPPGYELARVEISVFLHHLVTRFSWAPANEDKLVFFLTTRTLKRYPINVQRRRKIATHTEEEEK
uniref:Uncharacterized protein n=1 Tax=Nelumbo nucifera TaxID=4432 RepID=A0A822Y535_NELNU|nr:TPA_asm: hypothetical protein HUJ06_027804 [Nelumbo nucifera]